MCTITLPKVVVQCCAALAAFFPEQVMAGIYDTFNMSLTYNETDCYDDDDDDPKNEAAKMVLRRPNTSSPGQGDTNIRGYANDCC